MSDPVEIVNALGARWAANFDAYASGDIDASELVCVLCAPDKCTGHPRKNKRKQ